MSVPFISQQTCQCLYSTHIKDGDDGWVIPADYCGNVLCLGHLGGDQLKVKDKQNRERRDNLFRFEE